jgi:magnesium-protoporphyrin O-methyltransferase
VFSDRFARGVARRYRRRRLSRSSTAIVSFLTERGITGADVLEIGGGVGEIQVELLRRGATRATNLEISTNYEPEAVELLERAGMRDRVDRRFLDIAQVADEVESADIVVLHRPAAMLSALSEAGLHSTYHWRGFGWHVVGLER